MKRFLGSHFLLGMGSVLNIAGGYVLPEQTENELDLIGGDFMAIGQDIEKVLSDQGPESLSD